MNFASVCAQTNETPREVFISATATAIRCSVTLPPVGKKAPTVLELNVYGKKDRKSTRLNSSHVSESRMPSSA